ncbi:MAG: GNAT family N-acetyltransferase, partial [Variibacter sp.]|nr:GNAT family N-acetyltransferase [Variibacter sp.]
TADCTVFQCFDWLAAWQRHVGARTGTTPVIVVGRQPSGEPLFIIPLAVSGGVLRRLTFLGREVGDYNAPLLAPDFTRVAGHDFRQLWDAITDTLQHDPQGRHDVLVLDKMPETIGAQPNPFLQLDVRPNPSGAYLTALTGDWDSFYAEKRSSSTRRRDRTKRKKLSDIGEVRMTTPEAPAAILATLERLIAQKRKAFQRMGVADMFARPGYVDFLRELASAPPSRRLAHVSSLDVGDTQAATNLGLVFRGGYYHVLASYDDGPLSRFGPGAAHLHELMAYAIGRKCAFFDFTIGDEPYKRDWADREIMLHDCVKPASLRGRAVAAPLDFARRVKRAIKQSPTLWPMVLRLRAALGDTKRRLKGQTTAPAAKADGDD